MRITETEVILPVKIREGSGPDVTNPLKLLVLMCVIGILCLSMGIALLLLTSLPGNPGLLLYPFVFGLFFCTLLIALLLPMLIRSVRAGPWELRINHEGIFCCLILPMFIEWHEITALVTFSQGIDMDLRIVVENEMTASTRFLEEHVLYRWERPYYRFLMKMGIWFSHSIPDIPSAIFVSQRVLPLSIDDLVTVIRERFASELHEYHIPILEWQSPQG